VFDFTAFYMLLYSPVSYGTYGRKYEYFLFAIASYRGVVPIERTTDAKRARST